jgi:dTDP-4-dehydrorhamnose 3,5-epimerase
VIFVPTRLPGAFVVEPERRFDERGYFARTWCRREFESAGLEADFVQSSVSSSLLNRTLRGMHWQVAPHEEIKLVRCTRGAIWDAIIDLRAPSPTYMQYFAVELTAESGRALYVPAGCAHGFVTLEDESEVLYHMSNYYEPSAGRGIRWNDPAFAIPWPVVDPIIHPRDANYPDFVSELTSLAR